MRAFDTALGRMAMMVCNDAWRPALAFLAAQDGAHMILIPANTAESHFPDEIDNKETWYEITKFYALMFQVYVLFVNRAGEEGEFRFWGGSHVVDPSGQIVAEGPRFKEDLQIVDLDLEAVRRRRRALPIFTEARLDLLSEELKRLTKEAKEPYR
jgi:predicted amidohydrolase